MPLDDLALDGHLRSSDLVRIVATGARDSHIETCEECRGRAKVLEWSGDEMRALVEFAVRRRRRESKPPAAGKIGLLRHARDLAAEILAAAEIDDVDAELVLVAHRDDLAVVPAVLNACQRASRLAAKRPALADRFGLMIRDWAKCREEVIPAADALAIRLEALFVRVSAALQQGRAAGALRLAEKALVIAFDRQEHEVIRARAHYFHACALGAAGETDRAVAELEATVATFREYGLPSWEGKALAAAGTALFHRKASEAALERLDAGLALMDPEEDAHNIAAVLGTRAALLDMLKRRPEARLSYSQSLEVALKAGLSAVALTARVNLLGYALDEGNFREVLERGPRIVALAEDEGLEDHIFCGWVFLAEANFAAGVVREGDACLRRATERIPAGLRGDSVLEKLLAQMDGSNLDAFEKAACVRRVRAHLDQTEGEAQETA